MTGMVHEQWHLDWFNDDYLKLYADRDDANADRQMKALSALLPLKGGEKILDVACGKGRHALALSRLGWKVVGVDASESLVEEAKRRASEASLNDAVFLCSDIRGFHAESPFDVAISLFTSFGYYDDAANKEVLRAIRKALRLEGRFVLDYLHPYGVIQNLIGSEKQIIEGEEVLITREIKNDSVVKTITFPGRSYVERVKLYDRERLTAMLEEAGLILEGVYEDFTGAPWSSTGQRQLFICWAV